MPMYNLLEYSQNYSTTSGSLWNYYRDEIDDVNDNTSEGKSFIYKTKIVGKTPERSERPPQPPQNTDGTQPPRSEQPYEKLIEMSKNDDDTTGNLLDYLYHQKYCKLIVTDLS